MENDARVAQVINERDLLKATNFANLNRLVTTTKDEEKLCLVLELA